MTEEGTTQPRRVNPRRLWALLSVVWIFGVGAWGIAEMAPRYERFSVKHREAQFSQRIEETTGKPYQQWVTERMASCRESAGKAPEPRAGGIFVDTRDALFSGCMRIAHQALEPNRTGFAAFQAGAREMGKFIIAHAPVWSVFLLVMAAVPLLGWWLAMHAIPTAARALADWLTGGR